ncbi:MAG: efflux RND transporter periplasmic adaptor subunit [Planctomycetes bacterium]|nr:efflux RND transporter periplasmic adaptor subunit [Planctomycetota bacterium]
MRRPPLRQLLIGQTILIVVLVAAIGVLVARRHRSSGKAENTPKMAATSMGRGRWSRGGSAGGQAKARSAEGSTRIPVKVTKVARRSIDASFWDSTWLEADTRVDVLTKTSGEIVKMYVEEGDIVKEGDVLAETESDKEQVEYNKAKVEVNSAKIAIRNAEIALEKARISYENCKALYDRALAIYKQRVISSEEYDAKKVEHDTAKTEYDKAVQDLEAAKLKLSTEELNLETARLNLDYTKIRSPIAGVVTLRNVERGQVVNTNYAAFQVADYDPIVANLSVPETVLSKIRLGGPVRVQAEAMPGKELTGKVSLISPIAEAGKVKVEVKIANPPGTPLRPGMYATMHLVTETHENALVIPKRALVIESDANEVFVAQDIVQVKVPAAQQETFKVDTAVRIAEKIPAEKEKGEGKPKEKQGSSGGPAETEKIVEGTVANVLPPAEEGEPAEITIALPNDHGLQKGRPAKISPLSDDGGNAATVDVESLEPRTRALKRKLDLGLSDRNDIEVTKGLDEGERVVTAGNEELKNGSILLIMGVETRSGEKTEEAVAASTPTPRPAGDRRGGGGGMPAKFFGKMKERALSVPAVKAEFDKRVNEDPSLATDPKKFFEFIREMREKGLIQPRRRGRPE